MGNRPTSILLTRLWSKGQDLHAVPSAAVAATTSPDRGDISGFVPIATAVAALDGTIKFSYQTSTPTNLGFDLNILADAQEYRGTTIVTSYWSSQAL
jgi:hypothetical protein